MKYVLICICVCVLLPSVAMAGVTDVSRAQFLIEGGSGRVHSEVMTVTNQSLARSEYRVLADDEAIAAQPQYFTLEPGASRSVVLRFRQQDASRDSSVSLLAYEMNDNPVKLGNGLTLPVQFRVPQVAGAAEDHSGRVWRTIGDWGIYLFDLMLAATAFWLLKIRPRRKYKNRWHRNISFI